eukprot:TRINITY_DN17155_c0_g1_i2.p1 TRINITY_DN17155_c0_g1~~TRINITY_DN17155_c0_g1_i2.p1  ORF type:complete len:1221 (+),score=220.47 TRINITY_DN17155_c0_g1_i2:23-3685(+)
MEEAGTAATSERAVQCPPEVAFLFDPACNPDFENAHIRRAGNVRRESLHAAKIHEEKARGRLDCIRAFTDVIVNSWVFQSIVMAVILFDFVLMIIAFAIPDADQHEVYDVCDVLTLLVLTVDVAARCFVVGRPFFWSVMNVCELILVPLTFAEIFILRNTNIPVQLLRTIRPIFRTVRLLRVLLRAASQGERYLVHLRHQVSGDRVRFIQDGFDLDLAYITSQICVMPIPAVGRDSWLHNPAKEVARFFNERHPNKYLILNLTQERSYPVKPFFNRYLEFPIHKDGVPTLEGLMHLCDVLNAWLKMDQHHILAIHSRHGQGRASLVAMALLLHEGSFRTPTSAIHFFEHNRTHPDTRSKTTVQSCDCASQRRFLEYFARRLWLQRHDHSADSQPHFPRTVKLKQVEIAGMPSMLSIDVACFLHAASAQRLGEATSNNEEEKHEEVLATKKEVDKLSKRLHREIEDATFDSHKAGCLPSKSEPVFNSKDRTSSKVKSKSLAYHKDGSYAPGIWELDNVDLTGEFVLEITRRKLTQKEEKERKEEQKQHRKSVSTTKEETKGNFFEGGLLLSCWLHTDFLEQDEAKNYGTSQKNKQKTVVVNLDRWQLDKAADAPTLRSYSSALGITLTFEVEEKNEMAPLTEEHIGRPQGLSSPVEMTQPETLHWLTFVGKKIWPNFEKGFEKLVEENLIATLRDSLPAPLNNVTLQRFSLGDQFPEFGPINASSRDHDGKEVQMTIGLKYVTDTDVIIDLGLFALAIVKLSIKGTLCLKFKPILNELPVLCAMQLFFLNSPVINIRFGRALEIANSSLVRGYVSSAIDGALNDLLVLPNVMNINWGDPNATSDSAVSFDSVLPCSVLRIDVGSARNLKADSSMLRRSPDVHVKVHVGTSSRETSLVKQQKDPLWNEEFDFVVHDGRQNVRIVVYDTDLYGHHSIIGQIFDVTVDDIHAAGHHGVWLKLQDTPDKVESEIQLRAEMFDLQPDPHKIEKHMLAASSRGKSDPLADTVVVDVAHGEAAEDSCAPSVVLLVCQVFGGKYADKAHKPGELQVRVSVGKAYMNAPCEEAPEQEFNTSDTTQKSIHKLAALHMDSDAIADALAETPQNVEQILRKQGWNLHCKPKICLLLKESDLAAATVIAVELTTTDKHHAVVARGEISIETVLDDDAASVKEVLALKNETGMITSELDLQARLFAISAMESQRVVLEDDTETKTAEEPIEKYFV